MKSESRCFLAPGTVQWKDIGSTDAKDFGEEQATAGEELRQTLLTSLQMQNLVVLAGCGCSLEAGGPSMAFLWDKAVGSPPSKEAAEVFEEVGYDKEDPDIEALLSKVEAYLRVRANSGVSTFLRSAKAVIVDECSDFLDIDKLDAHKTFLHRLSRRRVRDRRLKIFTTNYDLCFEKAAGSVGCIALDGFSLVTPRRYDPRYFDYDIVRRPRSYEGIGSYLEGVFLLYKLHGSVNWARKDDGSIVEQDELRPEEACLIYPATGKYQQSFAQPHLEFIAQYLAAVREVNTCILAVGFGFNDNHLSEPLLSAVRSNPHLRIIVANPSAKAIQENTDSHPYWDQLFHLSRSGEDIWFVNAPFSDFANTIPNLRSLTPAESLEKAIKGVTGQQ